MVTFVPSDIRLWVNTPKGEGIVLCVENSAFDNMQFTVILQENGSILHFTSQQIKACINHTAEINLKNDIPKFPSGK